MECFRGIFGLSSRSLLGPKPINSELESHNVEIRHQSVFDQVPLLSTQENIRHHRTHTGSHTQLVRPLSLSGFKGPLPPCASQDGWTERGLSTGGSIELVIAPPPLSDQPPLLPTLADDGDSKLQPSFFWTGTGGGLPPVSNRADKVASNQVSRDYAGERLQNIPCFCVPLPIKAFIHLHIFSWR